jgi:hypothetical protein
MERFNRGQAVWVVWQDRLDYPQMHNRPGVVVKRIHPTSYLVKFVARNLKRNQTEWTLDRTGTRHHPSDLLDHGADPKAHLQLLREKWRAEAAPEKIAAREKEQAERKRRKEFLSRIFWQALDRFVV